MRSFLRVLAGRENRKCGRPLPADGPRAGGLEVSFSESGPDLRRTADRVDDGNPCGAQRRCGVAAHIDHQRGRSTREIEVTSFAESCCHAGATRAPAFSKMFVQTNSTPTRARCSHPPQREPAECALWMFHVSVSKRGARRLAVRDDRRGFSPGRDLRNASASSMHVLVGYAGTCSIRCIVERRVRILREPPLASRSGAAWRRAARRRWRSPASTGTALRSSASSARRLTAPR